MLAGNICIDDMNRLGRLCTGKRGLCSQTKCKHPHLEGAAMMRKATAYPPRLAHSLVHALLVKSRFAVYWI